MRLYFHVDRNKNLREGDVLNRDSFDDVFVLPAMFPFADRKYLDHLESLCREGLSNHGVQYLTYGQTAGRTDLSSFMIELHYEYIRHIYFKNMPSRLQSAFAFSEYEQALAFKRERGNEGRIYEVNFSGRCFVADMNLLTVKLKPEQQEYTARQYWSGKPKSLDKDYIPCWECLIDLPVTIGREIKE